MTEKAQRRDSTVLIPAGMVVGAGFHLAICIQCLGGVTQALRVLGIGLIPLYGLDCTILVVETALFVGPGAVLGALVGYGLAKTSFRDHPSRFIAIVLGGILVSALLMAWFASLSPRCTGGPSSL